MFDVSLFHLNNVDVLRALWLSRRRWLDYRKPIVSEQNVKIGKENKMLYGVSFSPQSGEIGSTTVRDRILIVQNFNLLMWWVCCGKLLILSVSLLLFSYFSKIMGRIEYYFYSLM